jgi:hypothetical protein
MLAMTDNMRVIRILCCALAIVTMANAAYSDSRLLYAEAQMVAGYDFSNMVRHRLQFYSMDQMDVMQKPSIGFDLVQRLSTETGDWGLFAVQARLAYDKTRNGKVEPQLYNTYLKVKPGFGDVWIGHNKPAFGLAMSLDNHGTLLQPLSMYGYGFDRDWGIGYYRDFESGNVAFSATLGSGMPVYFEKSYLFSGRASKGDLNQQNYNAGLSVSYGKILEAMGYILPAEMVDPAELTMAGLDGTLLMGRWENRVELLWHRTVHDRHFTAFPVFPNVLFHRITVNFLAENRLKCELQSIWKFDNGQEIATDLGVSYQLTPGIVIRGTAGFSDNDVKAIAQVYWYHKI